MGSKRSSPVASITKYKHHITFRLLLDVKKYLSIFIRKQTLSLPIDQWSVASVLQQVCQCHIDSRNRVSCLFFDQLYRNMYPPIGIFIQLSFLHGKFSVPFFSINNAIFRPFLSWLNHRFRILCCMHGRMWEQTHQ